MSYDEMTNREILVEHRNLSQNLYRIYREDEQKRESIISDIVDIEHEIRNRIEEERFVTMALKETIKDQGINADELEATIRKKFKETPL